MIISYQKSFSQIYHGPQNAGVAQNCGAGLFQTAITSVRIANFEKNKFFEEILSRALFKTLVIIVVFNPTCILDKRQICLSHLFFNTAQKPLGVKS